MTTIAEELQKLSPSALVELFVLDASAMGGGVSRFHAGTNGLTQPVVWQGVTYTPYPIEASGFEKSGKGPFPRPAMRVANIGGAIGAMCAATDDLIDARVTRKRTFQRFLDAVNFAKNNLLLWSNNLTQSAWGVTEGVTTQWDAAEASTRVVVTIPTDPYKGQTVSVVPTGKTFTFDVDVKGVGATVGKRVSLFIYGQAPFQDVNTGPLVTLTSAWQRISLTHTFGVGTTSTQVEVRVDPENNQFAVNDYVLVRNAQLSESGSSLTYQETSTTWNPEADPNAHLTDEIFFVNRKVSESAVFVEFELVSAIDVQGKKLPGRTVIQNVCTWQYRSAECGYTGGAVADKNDGATTDINLDRCGKRLSSCKLRFGAYAELPYGGFPGAGLQRR